MHKIDYDSEIIPRAKQLRKDMTEQERRLWYCCLKEYPVKFYKQRVIGAYIVDFYCAQARLAIELDGSQHYEDEGKQYDALRTAELEKQGIRVIRFSNDDVNKRFKSVCEQIDLIVQKRIEILHNNKEN